MGEKEKALALDVYLLDNECMNAVEDWLHEAAGQAGEGLAHRLIVCKPRDAALQAPFSGLPFVIAGSRTSVEECFASASDSAGRVLKDCAYFWTLSDRRAAAPSVAAISKDQGRTIALSWKEQYYNYILSPLRLLNRHEGLAGLSISTHRTRNDIERIANQYQGAYSPVLILGHPGSGKEVVSTKLWDAYRAWLSREQADTGVAFRFNQAKEAERFSVACGWFGETLLQDQLFGHEKGAYTGAEQRQKGLLETADLGCVFLDDFDVAPSATLGALLRVMSTEWGEEASFPRLGGFEKVKTNAWLVFATNADIPAKVAAEKIRPDFIYRFEDRVIHLRPLAGRPADIPQIALKLWQTIWRGHADPIGLGPSNLELLLSREIAWPGNIRQLRALLSLVASRQRLTREPLRALISEILAVGDYNRWVGIVLDAEVSPRSVDPGPPACLSQGGVVAFEELIQGLTPSPKAKTPTRIRLIRILNHAFEKKSIVASEAVKLNGGSLDTAKGDLKLLAGHGSRPPLLECLNDKSIYTPIDGMFRSQNRIPATPPPPVLLEPD